MQRCLIRTQLNSNVVCIEFLPHIYYVSEVGIGLNFTFCLGGSNFRAKLIQLFNYFVDPTLFMAFPGRCRVYFSCYRDHTCDVTRLGLSSTHASQTSSQKEHSFCAVFARSDFSSCIQHGDGRSVHNSLRANVHVGPSGHLSVLGNT